MQLALLQIIQNEPCAGMAVAAIWVRREMPRRLIFRPNLFLVMAKCFEILPEKVDL
jgi:hypothetical protein